MHLPFGLFVPVRRRTPVKNAFYLGVSITFKTQEDKKEMLEMFAPLAEYVSIHELTTISYELMNSDKDPLHVYILERYVDKENAFLGIHRSSKEFLSFREKLGVMIKDKGVVVEGDSFIESGMGFVH